MDKSCSWRSWQSTNHSWSPSVAETLVVRKVLLAFKDKWSRDSQRFNNSVWVFLKYNIQRNSRRNQTTQQMNISTLWAHICSFSLTAERSDGGQTDVNINAKFVILSPRADTGAFTPTSRLCEQVKRWSVELFLFLEMILAGIFQLISIFLSRNAAAAIRLRCGVDTAANESGLDRKRGQSSGLMQEEIIEFLSVLHYNESVRH